MALPPRVVVVRRRSELEELLDRHSTRGQAEFFLRQRDRDLAEIDRRHEAVQVALAQVSGAVPDGWRQGAVERADLERFLFAPEDVIVVVGQDGLVANVAKYLDGQPVIGVDPEPGRNPGVLVAHPAAALPGLLRSAVSPHPQLSERTMVRCELDDGQHLDALNEVFVGHPSHQSARYRIQLADERNEHHSSSGVIVATGTGATGWCASIARERGERTPPIPAPAAVAAELIWFAREAWPSPATGTELTAGQLGADERLRLRIEADRLVVFGDGLESDRLQASWGQDVSIGVSPRRLRLVAA